MTRSGAEYLAGLWRQDLPFSLLRQASHREGMRVTDKWRAPSWSLASIDGPVNSQGYRAGAILLDQILDQFGVPRVPEPNGTHVASTE